jgi:Ca2+/H+ antiporter
MVTLSGGVYPEQSSYVFSSSIPKLINAAAVLVLGMCFFAGGMRFSEQGFGQSMRILVPNQ